MIDIVVPIILIIGVSFFVLNIMYIIYLHFMLRYDRSGPGRGFVKDISIEMWERTGKLDEYRKIYPEDNLGIIEYWKNCQANNEPLNKNIEL